MMSEPWVSTTFPSKAATFFASSAIRLSDSILTGLSRSARSALAVAVSSAHHVAIASAAAASALFPVRRIEGALDLRLQHELVLLRVHDHAYPGQDRASIGDGDGMVRARDPFFGKQVEEFGARAQLRQFRRGLAHEQDIAVKKRLFALPMDGCAIGRRDEVCAAFGQRDDARVDHFARAVI